MIPVVTQGQPAEWEGLEAEELVHVLVRVQECGPALGPVTFSKRYAIAANELDNVSTSTTYFAASGGNRECGGVLHAGLKDASEV